MTHLKLANGAWVVVGDGQKALFLINEGDEVYPNLRRLSVEMQKDPPTHEQGSDAPGRAYSSVGRGRSAVEETDRSCGPVVELIAAPVCGFTGARVSRPAVPAR